MIKSNKISASLKSQGLTASLKPQGLNSKISPKTAIKDHSKLKNLEYLNSGHTGFAGIEFGTTAEWNAKIGYRPPEGMLVVYTDYRIKVDQETGDLIYIPNFKIGDGNAYLIDKPFIGDDLREDLQKHLEDTGVHIQPGERDFWNNKLNYIDPEDDLLEFTRD